MTQRWCWRGGVGHWFVQSRQTMDTEIIQANRMSREVADRTLVTRLAWQASLFCLMCLMVAKDRLLFLLMHLSELHFFTLSVDTHCSCSSGVNAGNNCCISLNWKTWPSPGRCSAHVYYGIYYREPFVVSSLHLHLHSRSCAAERAETVGLTVASLQSCFNGTSMPASPGTRRLAVAAGYRRPGGCRSNPLCGNLPPYQAPAGKFSPLWTLNLRPGCHTRRPCVLEDDRFICTEAPWAENSVSSHYCHWGVYLACSSY